MTMPLEGLKVIDLTRLAPGPFCTMVLGDLGAEVIRVEEPIGGDQMGEDAEERRLRAAFDALGRNKRSVALNLKDPDGQQVLHRLCRGADVFVEGFRPGVVARLGCDYSTLRPLNSRLVYCSISGYGQDGPYRDLVGHDINYISIGGVLGTIGHRYGPPAIPNNLIADYAAGGMHATMAILAALMARERTGRGQHVDIAMADGVAYILAAMASEFFRTGDVPRPGAMRLNGGVPYYNVYECKDGRYISVGCIEPAFWAALCRALELEEFIPHQHDQERHPEIFDTFRKTFASHTRDEWWDRLSGFGDVAVGKVNSLDEVFQDPQLRHRRMVEQVGRIDGRPVHQVGIGPKLSDTPGAIRCLGPYTGQHTEEILRELGYSSGQVEALQKQGAAD